LHTSDKDSKEVWINADAIVAVMDMRPDYNYTTVAVQDLEYRVQETAGSVLGLIKQQTNPLDNYVCPTPVPVSWSLSKEVEE
jgi:hypothetical protein